jgi:putative endonuclease
MNKRMCGTAGEDLAIAYLTKLGYAFVARNVYIGGAELDLVMQKGAEYFLIEVKYRNSMAFGAPIEAMTVNKCRHFKRACTAYMQSVKRYQTYHFSFLGILKTEAGYDYNWIEDFFN